MAQFRYLGEPERTYVTQMGPTKEVRVPKKDGTKLVFTAPDPQVGFPVGHIFDLSAGDERSLRMMRADPRFQEV